MPLIHGGDSYKVGMFIPCFNVEPFIEKVISGIPQGLYDKLSVILIVDNNSDDNTREVIVKLREKLKRDKIVLLHNRQNYNLGGSYKVGFDYFVANKFDFMIAVHGRGQGQAGVDTAKFIDIIDSGKDFDFIGCSRFLKGSVLENYSNVRRIGNAAIAQLQKLVTGNNMSDPGTGHFCIKVSTLAKLPYHNLTSERFLNNELQMNLSLANAKMLEIPHVWRAFEYEKAKFNIWGLGFKIVLSLFKCFLHKKGVFKFKSFSHCSDNLHLFEYDRI